MYAIKGIYDGAEFKPVQPVPVNEGYEILITFLEPLNKTAEMPVKRKRSDIKGLFAGKIWMADDFDAPIDEMREYME